MEGKAGPVAVLRTGFSQVDGAPNSPERAKKLNRSYGYLNLWPFLPEPSKGRAPVPRRGAL